LLLLWIAFEPKKKWFVELVGVMANGLKWVTTLREKEYNNGCSCDGLAEQQSIQVQQRPMQEASP
jgi:hypothetical protein